MYYHQVSLPNRGPQPSSKSKITKAARLSIVNFKLNSSDHLSELKRLHIITIPPQGLQSTPVSLSLYLQSFNSNDQKEIGTFAFLEQPSQTSSPSDAFDIYSISKDEAAFIFIKLKQNYFFSEINVNNSPNKINFTFSHIEFPGVCFKTPEKIPRYFDEVSQSILSKKFFPQEYIYSIKTNSTSLKEHELVSELMRLQQKNQNRKLSYIINYKSRVSQRSTEENSSEEERRTSESEIKHQSSSRVNPAETSSQSRISESRGRVLTKEGCREYLSKCSNAPHQGSGSSSNKVNQVQIRPPEHLKTENNLQNSKM